MAVPAKFHRLPLNGGSDPTPFLSRNGPVKDHLALPVDELGP